MPLPHMAKLAPVAEVGLSSSSSSFTRSAAYWRRKDRPRSRFRNRSHDHVGHATRKIRGVFRRSGLHLKYPCAPRSYGCILMAGGLGAVPIGLLRRPDADFDCRNPARKDTWEGYDAAKEYS